MIAMLSIEGVMKKQGRAVKRKAKGQLRQKNKMPRGNEMNEEV